MAGISSCNKEWEVMLKKIWTNSKTLTMTTKEDQFNDFEGEETLGNEAQEHLEPNGLLDTDPYPYQHVNIGKEPYSVFQLYRKYKNNTIKLDPEFQREGNVWSLKQKSELIESILIRVPLPIFYVKEDRNGNLIIIDGRQRLSAIFDYLDNQFALTGLKILSKYNGRSFGGKRTDGEDVTEDKQEKELSNKDRGEIEDTSLTLHIIKEPTPDRLTYELFDRVNRGRTRLNNQEMRNAIYQGSSTLYLKTLSRLAIFKELTKSIPSTRMKDRYLILRFVAFYLWRKKLSKDTRTGEIIDYKSDLEDFLARSMDFMNTKTYQTEDLKIDQLLIVENNTLCIEGTHKTIIIEADTLLHNVSISFAQALQNIQYLFGDNSFRLPPKKDRGNTRPINMALFEVTVYFFIELETEFASKSTLIKTQYEALIDNKIFAESQLEEDNFVSSVSNSVDSNKAVHRRFQMVEQAIKSIKTT